tara:strand:- start:2046 stop:7418 length:5373 start_codon:yes stop_codon:yes gene_type:complete
MANELRSTFIRSKMNKDLDARIVPPGEYRDAVNIAVSKSEGADVGAVENVLGNKLIASLSSAENYKNAECIGIYGDKTNNRIFLFITDYSDNSEDLLSNKAFEGALCAIWVVNFEGGANSVKLIEGSWLNFSKNSPIFGISLLEDTLFWTDNRNQPRRISVSKALDRPADSSNPYYQIEENISVATYYPYEPPQVYQEFEVEVVAQTNNIQCDERTSSTCSQANPGINPVENAINLGSPPIPPKNYPQVGYQTIFQIQSEIPEGLKLHPGIQFYIKKSTPGPNPLNPGTNFGPLQNITTYPYYNEIRNYPIAWGPNSYGNCPNPTPKQWDLASTNLANRPRAGYGIAEQKGNGLSGISCSYEYLTNPEVLLTANDGESVKSAEIGPASTFPQGARFGHKSSDYQENYLKWFYSNIPLLDGNEDYTDIQQPAWYGTATIVFVVPKMVNKTDQFLPPTYRCEFDGFYSCASGSVTLPESSCDASLPNYGPGYNLASNGSTLDEVEAQGIKNVTVNQSWLPRITGDSDLTNYPYYDGTNNSGGNDMILESSQQGGGGFFQVTLLTPYQRSVSNGFFMVSSNVNGYEINSPQGSAAYLKNYLQPGMRIYSPIFNRLPYDFYIDQIFVNHLQGTSIGNKTAFSVYAKDKFGNYIENWVMPEFCNIKDNAWIDFHFVNPYYDPIFSGDKEYLKDKFCKLSYRFQFENDQFSLIAPFSQTLFSPKDEGYYIFDADRWDLQEGGTAFLMNGGAEPVSTIETTSQGTINPLYENSINEVSLVIKAPKISNDYLKWNEVQDKLKVKNLQIIFSESDSNNLRLLKSIPMSDPTVINNNTDSYVYVWQGDKPIRSLPSNEATRVWDQVPLRALAQEISGNRVIYGNFVDRHSSPDFLDFDIGVDLKYATNTEFSNNARVQYTHNTLKGNRSYQVGVVLADKFGRQSDVILSSPSIITSSDNQTLFSGDTFTAPYLSEEKAISLLKVTGNNLSNWQGDSLKMLWRNPIPEVISGLDGYPGLYTEEGSVKRTNSSWNIINSGSDNYSIGRNIPTTTVSGFGSGLTFDILSIDAGAIQFPTSLYVNNQGKNYRPGDVVRIEQDGANGCEVQILEVNEANPLGFYSYKIVVKQDQQDYYNLYLPQIINGEPLKSVAANPTTFNDETLVSQDSKMTFATIGDNINKIQRDVEENNGLIKYISSSTTLWPRVSQFGGIYINTWAFPGSGGTAPGSDWTVDTSTIYTGNVFNQQVADSVINVGQVDDIYGDNVTNVTYETITALVYKQQANPWITVAENGTNRNPFMKKFEAIYGNTWSPGSGIDQIYAGLTGAVEVTIDKNTSTGQNKVVPTGVGVAGNLSPSSPTSQDYSNVTYGAFNCGLAVVETTPFESNVDIFWETSTAGVISDLNYDIVTNVDEQELFDVDVTVNPLGWNESDKSLYWSLQSALLLPAPPYNPIDFYPTGGEPTAAQDPWIISVTPKNIVGGVIPLNRVVGVPSVSVVDNLGNSYNSFVMNNNVTQTSEFKLYNLRDQIPYLSSPNQGHIFTATITFETLPELPIDPNFVKSFDVDFVLENSKPVFVNSPQNPRRSYTAPTDPNWGQPWPVPSTEANCAPQLTTSDTGIVVGEIPCAGTGANVIGVEPSYLNGMFTQFNYPNGVNPPPTGLPSTGPPWGAPEDTNFTGRFGRPERASDELKYEITKCVTAELDVSTQTWVPLPTTDPNYYNALSKVDWVYGPNGQYSDPSSDGTGSNFNGIRVANPIPQTGTYLLEWKVTDANDNDADGNELSIGYPDPNIPQTNRQMLFNIV